MPAATSLAVLLVALAARIVAAGQHPEASASPAPGAQELGRAVDAYVRPFVAAGHLSGSLLVARGEEILLERAWGQANLELGVPNTAATHFCVASVTKPMTIALAARLIEERKLGVEDPLEKWIPGMPQGERITVSHLLNHRAGIPHRVTTTEQEATPLTAAEVVELARAATPLCAPGERSIYSSACFSVLARVLELAGGKPYGELLSQYVFAPAGMVDSAHAGARALLPGRASAYVPGPDGLENAPLIDMSFLVGAGSVWSTARDLFRFGLAVRTGKLGPVVAMALEREDGQRWYGATGGYRAFADHDPKTDVTVVFASNVATGAVDLFRAALPRLAAGESMAAAAPPDVRAVPVEPDALRRLAGRYRFREGSHFDVSERAGTLWAGDRVLVPTADGSFHSPQDYGTVRFSAGSPPEQLEWTSGGTATVCPRIGD